jgi:hypothetical protein
VVHQADGMQELHTGRRLTKYRWPCMQAEHCVSWRIVGSHRLTGFMIRFMICKNAVFLFFLS